MLLCNRGSDNDEKIVKYFRSLKIENMFLNVLQNYKSYQSQELCDMGFLNPEVQSDEQTRPSESSRTRPISEIPAPGIMPGGRGRHQIRSSALKAAPAPREGT